MVPDILDLFLDCQLLDGGKGKAKEESDATFQSHEGIMVCTLDFLCRATNRSGIGESPVSGHWVTGPDGADFFRCVVTDGKDEIELGRIGLREFVPTLALKAFGGYIGAFELRQSFAPHCARRMAPSTVSGEVRLAFVVENSLGHDGTGGIARAEKEHIVCSGHSVAFPGKFSCSTPGRSRFSSLE